MSTFLMSVALNTFESCFAAFKSTNFDDPSLKHTLYTVRSESPISCLVIP